MPNKSTPNKSTPNKSTPNKSTPNKSVVPTNPPPARKPRAKKLTGPIVTWRSANAEFPKLHLDPVCTGLERVTLREQVDFATVELLIAQALSEFTEAAGRPGRPCRACALESVLYTVLSARPRPDGTPEHQVFVTFSSQPAPEDPGTKVHRYKWSAVTPSGEARLAKVAKRAGLATTQSPAGLVAYGFVPLPALDALGPNLRTYAKTTVTELPTAFAVETFWALENDCPAQLGTQTYDPWQTALLLDR